MIVGFSKHGTGGGHAPVNYLTSAKGVDGTPRIPPPEVVRGSPGLTRMIIDSLDFERRYVSGVLSFSPGEEITPEMEQSIIDRFEEAAFAGLEEARYNSLWVRHEHAGHHELHFLVPRVELATGKSLNIHPPVRASKQLFDAFRSMINAEYGLSDPDDVRRVQAVSLPNHLARLQADEQRKGNALKSDIREAITEQVARGVAAGHIEDRAGVVGYLESQGFAINRQGAEYITVITPSGAPESSGGTKLRLKGGIYSSERFDAVRASLERQEPIRDVPDPEKAAEHQGVLERLVAAREAYHLERYGRWEEVNELARMPESDRGEGLGGYLERTLGDAAFKPGEREAPSQHRRRDRQQMHQEIEEGLGLHDEHGTSVTRQIARLDGVLSGARALAEAADAAVNRAARRFEQAGQRLGYASGGLATAAPAFDEWLEQWFRRFYGLDRGREDYGHEWDIER